MTLEELRDQFALMLTGERAARWSAGDLVCEAIRATGNRSQVFRDFAAIGHCTTAHVRQLAEVSATFGTEQRFPDVAPSLYRACVNAAKRLRKAKDLDHPMWDAVGMLTEALKHGWHVKEVSVFGARDNGHRQTRLRGRCAGCGAEVSVRSPIPFPSLPCPVCVRQAWEDGRDGKDVEQLGVIG